MAFCGSCGSQLQGDERFCAECGKEVSANPTSPSSAPSGPVQAVQAAQSAPGPYMQPGQIPVALVMPQPPAKRWGWKRTLIVIAALLALGYYHNKSHNQAIQAAAAALAKQQNFHAEWQNVNGIIQVDNGKWSNNSNVAIQSATLECDQYAVNGADISQMRTTLDGPVNPGAYATFQEFQMGTVATNMDSVKCNIVNVTPAN